MAHTGERRDGYLAEFDRVAREPDGRLPASISKLRKAAIDRFCQLGFPTTKLEAWRFTNVAPIAATPFALADDGLSALSSDELDRFTFKDLPFTQLVVVNGCFAPQLSSCGALPAGVEAGGLSEAIDRDPTLVERYLTRLAPYEDQPFTALNTAFLRDGAFLQIPANAVIEQPIHLLFVATAHQKSTVHHPRVLILAGENSQARIVESYAGLRDAPYFTNAVTEIVAGPNAVVDHYKLLRESLQAFHVASMHVSLGRSSSFSSHSITLGGALVRNDVNALLNGEGIDCTLNGLYVANGRRLIDNHTMVDHAKPHCSSHELYKGILDGEAHAVFNGKIVVQLDAQKTDAKQTNQALLLSEHAQINTTPQLEIFADDVRCTHGATVGQLDDDAMFYLRSRGLSQARARNVLIRAFASDILDRIKIAPIRAHLDRVLLEQLLFATDDEHEGLDVGAARD